MGIEIDFQTVADKSGISVEAIKKIEVGSFSGISDASRNSIGSSCGVRPLPTSPLTSRCRFRTTLASRIGKPDARRRVERCDRNACAKVLQRLGYACCGNAVIGWRSTGDSPQNIWSPIPSLGGQKSFLVLASKITGAKQDFLLSAR